MTVTKYLDNDRKLRAVMAASLSLAAWLCLYGVLPHLLGAGYADARRVLAEGAAALPLLALALRDGATREALAPAGRGKPRYAAAAAVLVPALLLYYAAGEAYCLTDSVRYAGDPADLFPGGAYAWYVLRTCVTAPLMEELGCRWLAFGRLRREFGFWPSALASAALFGLIHVGVHPDLPLAVLPGALLYCLVYEATGSIGCSIAAHAAHNVLALPSATPAGAALEGMLFGVPRSIGSPLLLAAAAAIALLCAYRDRLFRRVPPAPRA